MLEAANDVVHAPILCLQGLLLKLLVLGATQEIDPPKVFLNGRNVAVLDPVLSDIENLAWIDREPWRHETPEGQLCDR